MDILFTVGLGANAGHSPECSKEGPIGIESGAGRDRFGFLAGNADPSMTLTGYRNQIWPIARQRLAAKTAMHETWILDRVLLQSLGDTPLCGISNSVVGDLVAHLSGLGYASPSINGMVAVLRKIIRDSVERGILAVSPVTKFPRQREPTLRLELNDDERARFVAAFDNQQGFMRTLDQSKRPREAVESRFFRKPRRFGGGPTPGGAMALSHLASFAAAKPLFPGRP